MEDTSQLIWGMYFMYGKKQKAVIPLSTGIALFIFPYFISNIYMLLIVGTTLVALPYFVRV